MGWELRVFQSLNLTLFKSLIIHLPEYCCHPWIPWKAKDIRTIEAIPRTFTYKNTEVQHISFSERLDKLNLYSLSRRRVRYIII